MYLIGQKQGNLYEWGNYFLGWQQLVDTAFDVWRLAFVVLHQFGIAFLLFRHTAPKALNACITSLARKPR